MNDLPHVLIGLVVCDVGSYYFFSDPPVATGSVGGPEISDEAVERAQIKHWEQRCALRTSFLLSLLYVPSLKPTIVDRKETTRRPVSFVQI